MRPPGRSEGDSPGAQRDSSSAQRAGASADAIALTLDQQRAWLAAVASWCALFVLLVAWEWFVAPIRPGGSWLVLKALPLLLPQSCPGQLQGQAALSPRGAPGVLP